MRRRRWLAAPIAALAGMLVLAAPGVAQTQISPQGFLDRLGRAAELAQLDGMAPSPQRMADLRAALDLPVEIVIGDWTVAIERDAILEDLSGESADDFVQADLRLAAISRSLDDAVSRDPRSAATLAEALAGAYRGVVPPRPDPFLTVMQLVDDVFQAIVQRLGNLLANAGNALAWIALVAIVVVAGWFLLRAQVVPDRRSRAGEGRRAASSVDWAARAEEALRAGDLHEAVRASYLALLAVLAGRGIVANAPALTAGEARFAVRRARPALFPTIARATDSYERVIYGGATPDRGDVEQLREAAAEARKL